MANMSAYSSNFYCMYGATNKKEQLNQYEKGFKSPERHLYKEQYEIHNKEGK